MKYAIGGALVTAAVSTLGDYLWANVLPHQRPIYGLAHGALLFLTVGFCLGVAASPPSPRLRRDLAGARSAMARPVAGAAGGALIGFAATVGFYLLQPYIGYSALFVLFVGLWVALGVLNGRVLQQRDSAGTVLLRSLLAAVGSGLGFYAISGIWFPFAPHGWDYAKHFVYWTIAYLPGFAALLLGNKSSAALSRLRS
jgi:hypothetical protein